MKNDIKYLPNSIKFNQYEIGNYLKKLAGKEQKRSWCRNPWYNFSIKNDGYGPCCRITFKSNLDSGKVISQLWNSQEMQKLRKDLVNGNIGRVSKGDPFNREVKFHPCYNCPDRNIDLENSLSYKKNVSQKEKYYDVFKENSVVQEYLEGKFYLKNSPEKISVCNSDQGRHSKLSCLGEKFPEIKLTMIEDCIFYFGYNKNFKVNFGQLNNFYHRTIIFFLKNIRPLKRNFQLIANLNPDTDFRYLKYLKGFDNVYLNYHFGQKYDNYESFSDELIAYNRQSDDIISFSKRNKPKLLVSFLINKYSFNYIDNIVSIARSLNCDIVFSLLENNYSEGNLTFQSQSRQNNVIINNNEKVISFYINELKNFRKIIVDLPQAKHTIDNVIDLLSSHLRDLKYNNYALSIAKKFYSKGAYKSGERLVEGLIEKYPLYYKNYIALSKYNMKNRDLRKFYSNLKTFYILNSHNKSSTKIKNWIINLEKTFTTLKNKERTENISRYLLSEEKIKRSILLSILRKVFSKGKLILKNLLGIKFYKKLSFVTKRFLYYVLESLIYNKYVKKSKRILLDLIGIFYYERLRSILKKIITILSR